MNKEINSFITTVKELQGEGYAKLTDIKNKLNIDDDIQFQKLINSVLKSKDIRNIKLLTKHISYVGRHFANAITHIRIQEPGK